MKVFLAFCARYAVVIGLLIILFAAAIGHFMSNGREVDVNRAFQTDPRSNRAGSPPTGLKQNPGRPRTE